MFYVKTLEHEIELEPIHFGQKLRATIVRLLKEEVEGLALANYGFVVNVIEVPEDQIRSGIIEYEPEMLYFMSSTRRYYYDHLLTRLSMLRWLSVMNWVSLPTSVHYVYLYQSIPCRRICLMDLMGRGILGLVMIERL